MSKVFNTQDATNKFFTQDKQTTEPKKPGRPKKDKPLRGYRFNIGLDEDLYSYMHQVSWERHQSITQYINDVIREDMNRYFAEGGKIDPYFKGGE